MDVACNVDGEGRSAYQRLSSSLQSRDRERRSDDKEQVGHIVAQAPLDHSLDAFPGAARVVGPRLLHLSAVRRADDAGAGVVAQLDVRRTLGRAADGRPLFHSRRRLDRSRARPQADDGRIPAGGAAAAHLVAGRLPACVLRVVDRPRRLPGGHSLRTRLRGDHAGLWSALQAGDPADDVPRRPRQHLRYSLRPAPDRADGLAADARRAGGGHAGCRRRALAVRAWTGGGGGADRGACCAGRRQHPEEPVGRGRARSRLLGPRRGLCRLSPRSWPSSR